MTVGLNESRLKTKAMWQRGTTILNPATGLQDNRTIRVNRRVNSTGELGGQKIVLTPGASSTCNGNACCCCSCF